MFHIYVQLYKWNKKIPVLHSDFVGMGGQMICITQLTIHDFVNKQIISTSNSWIYE